MFKSPSPGLTTLALTTTASAFVTNAVSDSNTTTSSSSPGVVVVGIVAAAIGVVGILFAVIYFIVVRDFPLRSSLQTLMCSFSAAPAATRKVMSTCPAARSALCPTTTFAPDHGLAAAYAAGFQWGLDRGYQRFCRWMPTFPTSLPTRSECSTLSMTPMA